LGEHRYVHSVEKDDVELARLRLQADVHDPFTIRRLEAIGISEGWRCLEVGAGTGSIVQWLSSHVGASGKVVATDIDLRFLSQLGAGNLEIRRHDILKDDLEKDSYDLAHCRMVLVFLPEPEKALKKMADAVRPGGWLFVEDLDCGSMLSADVTDPSAAPYVTAFKATSDVLHRKGISDLYFGRRLRGLVEGLGYEDVRHEGFAYVLRGSDPMADMYATSHLAAARPMIAAGLLRQEDVDKVRRLLLDPDYSYPGRTLFGAWGRKPAGERRD
jgi:SAM-dependent methyltransferase